MVAKNKGKSAKKSVKTKTGIDDLLAAGGTAEAVGGDNADELVETIKNTHDLIKESSPSDGGEFDISGWLRTYNNKIQKYHENDKGGKWYSITNFSGEIVEAITECSNGQKTTFFIVKLTLSSGETFLTERMTTKQFDEMSWLRLYGSYHVQYVPDAKNILAIKVAISDNSKAVKNSVLKSEIGWSDDESTLGFYHASGIVGKESGSEQIIDVEESLESFDLSEYHSDLSLSDLYDYCEKRYELMPSRLNVFGRGAVYRAPLNHFLPCDTTLFFTGGTGTYKSCYAGVLQSSYGKSFDYNNLPISWESTTNSIQTMLNMCKDVVCTIDDYAPNAAGSNPEELYAKAERVIRAVGNNSSRSRLNGDFKMQRTVRPRATPIGTAEEIPRGHSILGRMVINEVKPGEVIPENLTLVQEAGRKGYFVSLQRRYISYLSRTPPSKMAVRELRSSLASKFMGIGGHSRGPENLANYALGWSFFFKFLVFESVISEADAERRMNEVIEIMRMVGMEQSQYVKQADSVEEFFAHLRYSLSTGHSYIVDKDGGRPVNFQQLGWRKVAETKSSVVDWETIANATKIGWSSDEGVYLDWDVAYRQAQKAASSTGETIKTSSQTLLKRIAEAGHLLKNENENKNRFKRIVESVSRKVVIITTRALIVAD
ncbi:hypothetical protein [Bdellovibrio bacteriovorus]|uniref:hypothetical protein n=1 Tax=Bdellovibrio bacteriovorus TaxID=959 RepID=UPI0035A63BEA